MCDIIADVHSSEGDIDLRYCPYLNCCAVIIVSHLLLFTNTYPTISDLHWNIPTQTKDLNSVPNFMYRSICRFVYSDPLPCNSVQMRCCVFGSHSPRHQTVWHLTHSYANTNMSWRLSLFDIRTRICIYCCILPIILFPQVLLFRPKRSRRVLHII